MSSVKRSSGTNAEKEYNFPPVSLFINRKGCGRVLIGSYYQANLPDIIPKRERNVEPEDMKALLVWRPTDQLTEDELGKYISVAKEDFKYTEEQALGLLYWHRYNIQSAVRDMGNFRPYREEWGVEDGVLFEQALIYHGKDFEKIRQMLPDKSMKNLVYHYYNSDKRKKITSVMDRQVQNLCLEEENKAIPETSGGIVLIESQTQNNEVSNTIQISHPTIGCDEQVTVNRSVRTT